MRVSIVTVVYNNEQTLTTAIESVLRQTYPDIEYIIIDGGSSDGTLDIISRYKDRVQRLVSEPDRGIYDAMNKGIHLASGEVIGILNSDDVYAGNEVLSRVMRTFQSDPQLDMVYGDLVYVKSTDLNSVVRIWKSRPYYERYFEDGHVPPHPSLFVRKRVYDAVGLFDLHMRLAADYEFMLRAFKRQIFKSAYIPELFVKMRLGGSTNKSIRNIVDGNSEILRAWKKNGLKVPYLFLPKKIFWRIIQFLK